MDEQSQGGSEVHGEQSFLAFGGVETQTQPGFFPESRGRCFGGSDDVLEIGVAVFWLEKFGAVKESPVEVGVHVGFPWAVMDEKTGVMSVSEGGEAERGDVEAERDQGVDGRAVQVSVARGFEFDGLPGELARGLGIAAKQGSHRLLVKT